MASNTAQEQTHFNPWTKIAKIWRKEILNPRRIPLYDYLAPYQNKHYEATLQAKPEIVTAIAELRHYRNGTGFSANLPAQTREQLKELAITGLYWFEGKPEQARAPLYKRAYRWILTVFWHFLVICFMLAALGIPIWKSYTIQDEVYFISKISTALVTLYMFTPYVFSGLPVFSIYWKFSETRLIHPLVPLIFVFLADIPVVNRFRNEIWFKAVSGLVGLLILIMLIYLVSIKKKWMLRNIRRDVRKLTVLPGNDETTFEVGRACSWIIFYQALTVMIGLEKGSEKIKIGTTKRDEASFRKDSLTTFVEALDLYGPPPAPFWRRAWTGIKLICRISDPHWEEFHHPLPKSPVVVMEIAFMISQLILYREYVAAFIDLVTTQSRVTLKLINIMMKETEPTDAAFAEFSRLIAGAYLGFVVIGIAFAFKGRPLVQGRNQIYFSIGLTAAKFLCSNYVAPALMIFALVIFGAFLRPIWRYIVKPVCHFIIWLQNRIFAARTTAQVTIEM